MPIPIIAYVAGAAIGAAGGVTIEYFFSSGQASRGDYVVAGTVGALPGGLGARGSLTLVSKLSKLRYFSRSAGDRAATVALGLVHPSSKLFIGTEIVGITSGLGAGYAVGQLYDHFQSRRDQHASRSRRSSSRTSTRGASTPGSSSKRRRAGTPKGKGTKSRRLSSRGRTTPWCSRHNRRHFCKYTRKR